MHTNSSTDLMKNKTETVKNKQNRNFPTLNRAKNIHCKTSVNKCPLSRILSILVNIFIYHMYYIFSSSIACPP